MKLIVRVPGYVIRQHHQQGTSPVPRGYQRIGRAFDDGGRIDAYDYALIGVHSLILLWRSRYDWWELLVWLGFWNMHEYDYFRDGNWRWDFWRSRAEMRAEAEENYRYGPWPLWEMGYPYGTAWIARLYRVCRRKPRSALRAV